jgi:hypothetical protein
MSSALAARARQLGLRLKGPLAPSEVDALGLAELQAHLTASTERPVNVLVVDPDAPTILNRFSIPVPR